jgi:hypothetical protein
MHDNDVVMAGLTQAARAARLGPGGASYVRNGTFQTSMLPRACPFLGGKADIPDPRPDVRF